MKINDDLYEYKYDNLYNITDIYLNKELINHYEYDNFNELIKEDKYILNKTILYTYDTEGNILQKQEYEINTDNLIKTDTYNYTNGNWEDQLTKYNNEDITYDEIGNPLTIGTKELTWVNGRQLDTYKDGDIEIEYSYDKNGIRDSKKVNNIITKYFTENNKIIFEESNNNVIYYIRDEEGSLIGIKYNNSIYYYIKNLQEDIIGITDSNYNVICRYEYDSWGRIITIKDNNGNIIEDESHIGIINPYRYRSYYYDKETKLYYLNSRYYNPEWGRFINADKYVSTQQGMLSTNMYQYTENNPISRADTLGIFWFTVIRAVIGAAISVAINGINNVASGDGFWDGWKGAAVGGAFIGGFTVSRTVSKYVPKKAVGVLASTGGAIIENVVNGDNTIINSFTGSIKNHSARDGVKVNDNWIKPDKVSTSIKGNYQKKASFNDAYGGMKTNPTQIARNMYNNKKTEKETKEAFNDMVGLGFGLIDMAFGYCTY